MERENLESLLLKLQALTHSDNEHEASLAMEKMQAILIKYNIDMASIQSPENETLNKDESILMNEVIDFDTYQPWRWSLVNNIAKANFCKTIRSSSEIHILGRKANVRAVESMYNWLEPQIERLAKLSGYIRSEKSSYIFGVIANITERLNASLANYQTNNPNSRAIIVNVQSEIDRYFSGAYPHVTHGRASYLKSGAFGQGQSDGNKVSIYNSSRQVNSGRLALGSGY
jgi:hypothetical protein